MASLMKKKDKEGVGAVSAMCGARLTVHIARETYYPGSIVRGHVTVDLKKALVFQAIRLRLTGKEWVIVRRHKSEGAAKDVLTKQRETFWKQLVTVEGVDKTSCTAVAHHDALECTISMEKSMHSGVPRFEAPAGKYCYPFEFELPAGVPPSFQQKGDEEDYAAVLYFVKAYIDLPGGREADVIDRKFFTVVSRIGQDQYRRDAVPQKQTNTHEVMCACISRGKITCKIEAPRSIVTVEQDGVVPFVVTVDNTQGNAPVDRVMVQLIHELDVEAGNEAETRRTVVSHVILEHTVAAGGEGVYEGKVRLPADVIPTMQGIMFRSRFSLFVEYDIPNATDPNASFPIVVAQAFEADARVRHLKFLARYYDIMGSQNEYTYAVPATDAALALHKPMVVTALAGGYAEKQRETQLRELHLADLAELPISDIVRSRPESIPSDMWPHVTVPGYF
jgi:hypothetical protein